MEKNIKLVMAKNKDIHIFLNNEDVHTISHDNRKILANDIFTLLNHSIGDIYNVNTENDTNVDTQVLEFFAALLKDITAKIQNIRIDEEQ